MDFIEDLKRIIIEIFEEAELEYEDSDHINDLIIQYLNVINRMIDQNPRDVYLSQTLEDNLTEEHEDAISVIRETFENGSDVNPHLSRQIFNPTFNDLLFNDWGVYHFHLSTTRDDPNDYFMSRTGPLLFAMVKNNEAYFLTIGNHGDWGKPEFLEIVENNWPDLLDNRKIEGARPVQDLDEDEIQELREAGINPIADIQGQAIFSEKGGITLEGGRVQHTLSAIQLNERMEQLEEYVNSNRERYKENLNQGLANEEIPDELDFRLELEDGKFWLVEDNLDVAVESYVNTPVRHISSMTN